MNFASVDAVLDDWAQTHQLHVHKMDRNVEVRSVEQRFGTHDGFQIWIDPPNADDLMGIHVWDFRKGGRRQDFLVSMVQLREYLDITLHIARSWSS
jgi:hypothetical protein